MTERLVPADELQVAEDNVIAALAVVEDAVRQATEIASMIIERAEHIRLMRSEGRPYREIVPNEERPLIVELLTANLDLLSGVGSRLRRAEARVLYDEGLTMDEIADPVRRESPTRRRAPAHAVVGDAHTRHAQPQPYASWNACAPTICWKTDDSNALRGNVTPRAAAARVGHLPRAGGHSESSLEDHARRRR